MGQSKKKTHPDPETRASEIHDFDSETGAKEIHSDSKTETKKQTLFLNPELMRDTPDSETGLIS